MLHYDCSHIEDVHRRHRSRVEFGLGCVILGVLSNLATILPRKRELVALLCHVAVCALCLFFKVPRVGL